MNMWIDIERIIRFPCTIMSCVGKKTTRLKTILPEYKSTSPARYYIGTDINFFLSSSEKTICSLSYTITIIIKCFFFLNRFTYKTYP